MKNFVIAALVLSSWEVNAQAGPGVGATYLGNDLDRVSLETISRAADYAYFRNGPNSPNGPQGTYYLNISFNPATLVLTDNRKYTNIHSRYDALHDVLEIKHEGKIYLLDGQRISRVYMMDSLSRDSLEFVSARAFQTEVKRGLIQILEEGKKTLLKRTEVIIRKPNYVPQFDAGSKVTTYVLQHRYYILSEDKKVNELKASRKSMLSALGSHPEEMDKYIKTLDGKLSDETNLRSIFQYFNTL
jgi:hypothetical protein